MKRRNVLYGLGLAGLASSVTALTGATLAETVTPTAEFRVNVEPDFFVRAARSTDTVDGMVGSFPDDESTTTQTFGGESIAYTIDTSLTADGTAATFGSNDPFVIANDEVNNNLTLALSIPLAETTYRFENLLFVQNGGGFNVTSDRIAMQFVRDVTSTATADIGFGADVADADNPGGPDAMAYADTSEPDTLSANQVATVFDVIGKSANEQNRIAPEGVGDLADHDDQFATGPQQAPGDVLLNPKGQSVDSMFVDVIVDLTATENFAGATSPSGEFTDGTAAAALETVAENKPGDLTARGGQIDLLDTVFLGTG